MIKVDYIVIRDINKLATIHSKPKYINWTMKVIDNEYRFYPPIVNSISVDIDLDDFEFDSVEETSFLDDLFKKEDKVSLPMFGEKWDSSPFFTLNDRAQGISKGMNCRAKLEKYIPKTKCRGMGSCIKRDKGINSILKEDSYKMFKTSKGSNCSKKLDKYKSENIEDQYDFVYTFKVSRNGSFPAKIKKYLEKEIEVLKADDDIEILTLE